MAKGFAFLEHTADVGIRAWGASLGEVLEQAARGLVELMGVAAPGPGDDREVVVRASDDAALLVAFLNEVLFVHEVTGAGVADVRVGRVERGRVVATISTAPVRTPPAGIAVKAATYHQVEVSRHGDLVEGRVYLDV